MDNFFLLSLDEFYRALTKKNQIRSESVAWKNNVQTLNDLIVVSIPELKEESLKTSKARKDKKRLF